MARIFTVTQIITYLKKLVTKDVTLRSVTVKGELSNVKYQNHIYFTLKDEESAIPGMMFESDSGSLGFRLENGMKVEITGYVGVYEQQGKVQLYARSIKREGRGELYERYLKLKDELEERGMFSDQYKLPIPQYISRLGVVTASTGAAVRDIIKVARRRNPYVEIILYPAKVQGAGAAESVARGIQVLDDAGVDVIIAGRGGGSIEDLWAFNETVVAEAIFRARTPVISAVGHETDTTIADYVADLRAPTPSAAAELAVYDHEEYLRKLDGLRSAMRDRIGRHMVNDRLRLKEMEVRLKKKKPDTVISEKKMRLANMEKDIKRLMSGQLSNCRVRLSDSQNMMSGAMHKKQTDRRHRMAIYAERLKAVSPLEKLTQGYSYVTDEKGKNVRDASLLEKGDSINIYMLNGKVSANVREITEIKY